MIHKARTTMIAVVAAFSLASVAPAVSQAKRIQAHPTSDTPSKLQTDKCNRWANRLNDDRAAAEGSGAASVTRSRAQGAKDYKAHMSAALSDGCFVIT